MGGVLLWGYINTGGVLLWGYINTGGVLLWGYINTGGVLLSGYINTGGVQICFLAPLLGQGASFGGRKKRDIAEVGHSRQKRQAGSECAPRHSG